jgi:hypothetical protein
VTGTSAASMMEIAWASGIVDVNGRVFIAA